jgi:hypothetical protein
MITLHHHTPAASEEDIEALFHKPLQPNRNPLRAIPLTPEQTAQLWAFATEHEMILYLKGLGYDVLND